jgi:hypothetical protein
MEELQVLFCDLCNTSVPEAALSDGSALRLKGRLLGPCCLGVIRPTRRDGAAPERSSRGGVVPTVAILAAVAGAVLFLDWRSSEEFAALPREFRSIDEDLNRQGDQLASMERRLGSVVTRGELAPFSGDLSELRKLIGDGEARSMAAQAALKSGLSQFEGLLKSVHESHLQQAARLALLHDDVRALSRDMAELKAVPRPVATAPSAEGREDEVLPMPSAAVSGDRGLPPAIAHNVARLADADDGTRFEAVDELLATKDARVFEYIVPLAKDPDPFVRRLVLEGLGEYHSAISVDTLLTALADPEGIVRHTAYGSLKQVTGQTLPFDPDASADQRAVLQRKWLQWWEKNKKTF